MAAFGLVHGGTSGAWCWDYLIPELRQLGHEAWAVELPASDPQAGCDRYADVIVDSLASCMSPMILVGHSMGGLSIPLVPDRRPVRRMVFLCAVLPKVGHSLIQQVQEEKILSNSWDDGSGALPDAINTQEAHAPSFEHACNTAYNDLDPERAAWAYGRRRPQANLPLTEVTPLLRWPDVASSYILGRQDRSVRPEWSRGAAKQRLGTEAIEIDSGHCPGLSRPHELAVILDGLSQL